MNYADHEPPEETSPRPEVDFIDQLKHDLRTPLNAILGFGQLLEMDELTPDQKESVAEIIKGGRQLLALIDQAGEPSASRSRLPG